MVQEEITTVDDETLLKIKEGHLLIISQLESRLDLHVKEANETFRELSRQLILSSTVFLTVIGAVIANDKAFNIAKSYPNISFFSIVTLAISILCGIVQFITDNSFFTSWVILLRKQYKTAITYNPLDSKICTDIRYPFHELTIALKSVEHGANIQGNSSRTGSLLQSIFFVLGTVGLLGLLITLLYQ